MELDEDETQVTDLLAPPRAQLKADRQKRRAIAGDLFGAVTGRLLGIVEKGTPIVSVVGAQNRSGLRARSTVDLNSTHIGCEVLLVFEGGDRSKPIVLGILRRDAGDNAPPSLGRVEISVDGERMVVSAKNELVFRCGKSQLTLRQDGRIEISGETVVTKASGVNRILGGSVQLN